MRNSNLVQKTITDKNGVSTNRWVKPVSSPDAKKKLPAPAPVTTSPSTPHFSKVAKWTQFSAESFDPRTVSAVEELLASRSDNDYDARSLVHGPLTNSHSLRDAQHKLNNAGVFGDAILNKGGYKAPADIYVRGLHKTKEFLGIKDFLYNATEEQRQRAIALVTVANAAPEEWRINYNGWDENGDEIEGYDANDHHICLKDEPKGLRAFVMDHHERAEEIAIIMNERGTADLEMLSQLLEGGALREGVL